MNFGSLFRGMRRQSQQNDAPSHWIKCPKCLSLMYYKEVEAKQNVCPKCAHHFRIDAQKRIALLADEGSFVEHDAGLAPVDPLKFVDKKSYKKRIDESRSKTGGRTSSVVSASGGARMQESTFSLMQMSKTSAALYRLHEAGLPFISVLTDPTMGGVSASFAMLGDIIMAEPNALIGFAGQRVIKQTIGADLPEGFQRAEFLLEHGLIDMVVDRNDMKKSIGDFLRLFLNRQA